MQRREAGLFVELRSADATSIGERLLPVEGSCDELAQAAAVVLSAWLSDVHPDFAPELPVPQPVAPPLASSPGVAVTSRGERAARRYFVFRAELDADHDCRRALRDFEAPNAQALPAAWAERALFGRGACLLKLREEAAAARDFALYLERYPNGRFAAQLRTQRSR
ncbi:MAG: hypothetical protein K0R38_5132 [Polyangiaceae bacterium]|nr:hypothetical protein [Polyangiaceae bacterium]